MATFLVTKTDELDGIRTATVAIQAGSVDEALERAARYFEDWNLSADYTETAIVELPETFEDVRYITSYSR